MKLNHDINYLADNEIAGAKTINPLVRYCLGMSSLSEYLFINPNGQGSITFDLDFASIAGNILKMVNIPDSVDFDFKCRIVDNKRLVMQSGKVYFPDTVVSVSSLNHTLTSGDAGDMLYLRLTHSWSGDSISISSETVIDNGITHTLQTGNSNYRLTLPIATIHKSGNNWSVNQLHLGSYVFAQYPYFWLRNYDRTENQFLFHEANELGVKWVDAGECDENA